MKQIPLTQGKFALVDDYDYDFLMQWKWHAQKHKSGFYAARKAYENNKSKKVYMHRVILGVLKSHIQVDHKDLNTLNNQRSNLRPSTKSQNSMNKGAHSTNTSGFKGVSWNKKAKKWESYISINKKRIYLGLHLNKKSAALVYDSAAKQYHGEFAKLNFP